MAVKYICDWCGSDQQVGRVTLTMAVAMALSSANLPKFDQDLCKPCLDRLTQAVRGVTALTPVPA